MEWFTNFVKPKLASILSSKGVSKDEKLWEKCPSCEGMIVLSDLSDNDYVCANCEYHFSMPIKERLLWIYGDDNYQLVPYSLAKDDPLQFKDTKKYSDRLRDARRQTNSKDAVEVAFGSVDNNKLVSVIMNFNFLGGSMGVNVGNAFASACERAVDEKAGLLVVSSSGGARMQEGPLSLMQMPRTLALLQYLKPHKLPFISLLTHPTTGGVLASFALMGDVILAEPGATIGFAGRRVIAQTVRENLPSNFQLSETLIDLGQIDITASRSILKQKIPSFLSMFLQNQQRN